MPIIISQILFFIVAVVLLRIVISKFRNIKELSLTKPEIYIAIISAYFLQLITLFIAQISVSKLIPNYPFLYYTLGATTGFIPAFFIYKHFFKLKLKSAIITTTVNLIISIGAILLFYTIILIWMYITEPDLS